jgi:hypothetical protein
MEKCVCAQVCVCVHTHAQEVNARSAGKWLLTRAPRLCVL